MMPTPILLRLRYKAGRRLDTVLATGPVPGNHWEALPLPAPLPNSILLSTTEPNYPELVWNGLSWEVRNHATGARIFVNDQPLAPHETRSVNIGDLLEIGLCGIAIEAYSLEGSVTPILGRPFDEIVHLDSDASLNINDDLFSDIPLNASKNFLETGSDNLSGSGLLQDDEPYKNSGPEAELARLNRAYFQVLNDPQTPFDLLNADGYSGRQDHREKKTILKSELLRDDGQLSLEELTTGMLNIDSIVEYFKTPGDTRIFDSEINEDVLHLFAPEDIKTSARLPDRTRRDHHAMGLDSSYYMNTSSDVVRNLNKNKNEKQEK